MKKPFIVGMMAAFCLAIAGELIARPAETTTVKVPFAFSVGSQTLPAGTYKLELTTQAQPGKAGLEVVVLRGKDYHAYASFVSRLVSEQEQRSGWTFQQAQGQEFLTEIRARGKRLTPAAVSEQAMAGNAQGQRDLIAEEVFSGR